MAATVVEAPLLERQELSPLCFLLRLGSPDIAQRARPAQFVMVRWAEGWPAFLSRPFSVADVSGPEDAPEAFELLIQARGRGTRALAELPPGERLRVTGPLGFGFKVVRDATAHILIAGGVGAAPFPLLARWIRRDDATRDTPVYFLIGAPTANRLFLAQRMEQLGAKVLRATEDGSAGLRGCATDLLPLVEKELGGVAGVVLYVAGPPGLLRVCAQLANERGLRCQLSMESRMGCGMGLCQGCVVKVRDREGEGWHYRRVCYEGPVMWAHEVIFD